MLKRTVCFLFLMLIFFTSCSNSNQSIEQKQIIDSEESEILQTDSKYSICKDASKALEKSEVNENIYEILEKSFKATWMGTGGFYPLDEIHKLCPIKELRKTKVDGYTSLYAIYQLKDGCIYLFFYYDNKAEEYRLSDYCYIEQMHAYAEFKGLKNGESTYSDVQEIDSSKSIDEWSNDLPNNENSYYPIKIRTPADSDFQKYKKLTTHVVEDGFVKIGYTKENGMWTVAKIKHEKSSEIQSIYSVDL